MMVLPEMLLGLVAVGVFGQRLGGLGNLVIVLLWLLYKILVAKIVEQSIMIRSDKGDVKFWIFPRHIPIKEPNTICKYQIL